LPSIRDADGDFARQYGATGASAYLIRPDGYLAYAHVGSIDAEGLVAVLRTTFA
jgi:pentachlorophenol monooxygenase